VRAVVVDDAGVPRVTEAPDPDGPGEVVRILACGLCGSDVEKLRPEFAGTVLGHEVVAETQSGSRVALVHHRACGACERCLAGHESTCEAFAAHTIRPGGFAERARAAAWIGVPDAVDDALGTMTEPLACVLRGAARVPRGRVLVVGHGFVGRLFAAVLADRGDDVFAVDADPRRSGRPPDGAVGAVVLCARGGVESALDAVEPGGTILVFADAGAIPAGPVYRRELTVVGTRSATPAFMAAAVELLPRLDLPEPTVLPLDRFAEGLDLYARREALKVVFTP
jgi:threonine dehydrogenase-like Zn-dependent dehydrogenase